MFAKAVAGWRANPEFGVDVLDGASSMLVEFHVGDKIGIFPEDIQARFVPHLKVPATTSGIP